jgi:hypothetical protein
MLNPSPALARAVLELVQQLMLGAANALLGVIARVDRARAHALGQRAEKRGELATRLLGGAVRRRGGGEAGRRGGGEAGRRGERRQGSEERRGERGPGRKPGASLYTRKRLSLSGGEERTSEYYSNNPTDRVVVLAGHDQTRTLRFWPWGWHWASLPSSSPKTGNNSTTAQRQQQRKPLFPLDLKRAL